MRGFAFLLGLCAAAVGVAQPVTRLWLKTSATTGSDSFKVLDLDSAGNCFVAGVTVLPTGKDAMLIAKFDRAGNKKWEKVLASDIGHTGANAIDVDANGNVVVVGYGRTIVSNKKQSRIVRISSAGVILFDRHGNAAGGSEWNDVAVDSNGEITATGMFNDGVKSIMRTSHYLVSGTLAWSRDYVYPGLTGEQKGLFVVVDANNDAYVAGVHDAGQYVYNTLVKYSRTSTQLWMKHMDGPIKARPKGLGLRFGTQPVMLCDVQFSTVYYQPYSVIVFEFNPQGTLTRNHNVWGSLASPARSEQFDINPLGEMYTGGRFFNGSNQLLSHYHSMVLATSGSAGTNSNDPDQRALCAGAGTREYYNSTVAVGVGPRPSTIFGNRWASSGIGPSDLWNVKIFGSTASNPNPYAELTFLKTDDRGDVFAIGHFSGADSQDAFIAKYETGPVITDATASLMTGQIYSSPSRGYLEYCAQVSQASYIFLQDAQHGQYSTDVDGKFIYIPDANFVGVDEVRYRMERTNSTVTRSAEGKVKFSVYAPIADATANPTTLQSNQITTISITLTKNAVTALPLGMSISPTLSYVQVPVVSAGTNTAIAKLKAGTITSSGTATVIVRSGTSTKTLTIALQP